MKTLLLLTLLALSNAALTPPQVPDLKRTPGAVLAVTSADVCTPGYAKKVRNVPASLKHQAYAAYGIFHHQPGEYEIDHLISLELGGSNALQNLWPQSYRTQPYNAHLKDRLENRLHAEVCRLTPGAARDMALKAAQTLLAKDWIAAYNDRFGDPHARH